MERRLAMINVLLTGACFASSFFLSLTDICKCVDRLSVSILPTGIRYTAPIAPAPYLILIRV
jgi:hypothetical protein